MNQKTQESGQFHSVDVMPLKTALLLYPGISPFHFSVPYMLFTEALPAADLFELHVITPTGERLPDQIIQIEPDGGVEKLVEMDIVVISGWPGWEYVPDDALCKALRDAVARGAFVVGLCYGAYALAYAGVLDGKTATTHWYAEADFRQRFPQVRLDGNAIYVEDGNLITSAGTAAALDCCLHIVRKFYGSKVSNHAARLMVVPPHREGGQAQFIERPVPQTTADARINALLVWLHEHIAEPCDTDSAAAYANMSRSTFTRHFRKLTGSSFQEWLVRERLQRSLEFLENTRWGMDEIAEKTGFQNTVSFRQQFCRYYGVNPHVWRKRFS